MPLTDKGEKIKGAMTEEYGDKKGEQVFYASRNKGKITGVDAELPHPFGEEGVETIKRAYNGEFESKEEPEHKEKAETTEEVEAKDMGEVEKRFDEVRDQVHKLDKRIDDCGAMDGEREQVYETFDLMGNPTGKTRRYGVKDGALLTNSKGNKIL